MPGDETVVFFFMVKALMEEVVQDDNANDDEEYNSKLNKNINSPGEPGGFSRMHIVALYSLLLSYFDICLRLILWNCHDLCFLSLETLVSLVRIVIPLFCYVDMDSSIFLIDRR